MTAAEGGPASQHPTVSVIMVCYNGADLLPRTLASLRAQTHEDWELVFWDNGSTDGSADFVRLFDSRARVLGGADRLSNGAARAAAAEASRGDFLAFLDHDDLWAPERLERGVAALRSGEADLFHSDCFVVDEDGTELCRYSDRVEPLGGHVYPQLLEENFVATVTVLLTREAYDDAGGFDRSLEIPADYDLWLRVAHHGMVRYDPTPLASYRIRAGSLTDDVDRAYAEVDGLYERWLERVGRESPAYRWVLRGRASHRWRHAVRGWTTGAGMKTTLRRLGDGVRIAGGPLRALPEAIRFLRRLLGGLRARATLDRVRRGR